MYVPPRDYCPIDVIVLTTADDVELGDHGTIVNFTVVTPVQYPGQEETEPFARVSIALDGPGGMLQLQEVLDTPVSDVHVGSSERVLAGAVGNFDHQVPIETRFDFDPKLNRRGLAGVDR